MKSMTQRQMKVAEEIRHIAGMALIRGDIPTRLATARITITAVWVSADLRQSRLYVALPADWNDAETLAQLNNDVAKPLRKVLARDLATKYIPDVTFWKTENDA